MGKYFITGISGVGKSSVVAELNKRGVKAMDVDFLDGLCGWVDGQTGEKIEYCPGIGKEWLDRNCYNCDLNKLEEIIRAEKGDFVVAGITTNQKDFMPLFDKVFLLHCDEKNILHRLNTRENNSFGNNESDQAHILGYYKKFEADMINHGAIPIDASAPLEEVVENIISEMHSEK